MATVWASEDEFGTVTGQAPRGWFDAVMVRVNAVAGITGMALTNLMSRRVPAPEDLYQP